MWTFTMMITGYFILANKMGTLYPQNGMQRCKWYATAMQKMKKFNDFSNTALTAQVDIDQM